MDPDPSAATHRVIQSNPEQYVTREEADRMSTERRYCTFLHPSWFVLLSPVPDFKSWFPWPRCLEQARAGQVRAVQVTDEDSIVLDSESNPGRISGGYPIIVVCTVGWDFCCRLYPALPCRYRTVSVPYYPPLPWAAAVAPKVRMYGVRAYVVKLSFPLLK